MNSERQKLRQGKVAIVGLDGGGIAVSILDAETLQTQAVAVLGRAEARRLRHALGGLLNAPGSGLN